MYRVYLVDDNLLDIADDHIAAPSGRHVRLERRTCRSEGELIARCGDADGLVAMTEQITRAVLSALPNLKVVARAGVGVDSVDVEAATEHGVQVTNVPDGNYRDVAVHALTLILNAVRKVKVFDTQLQDGNWQPLSEGLSIRRPDALRLGIIGFGRSGRELARLAASVGFNLVAYARPRQAEVLQRAGVPQVPLSELLATADVISLHVPLTAQTRHLIDETALTQVKPGAILVNTARGGLIDENALVCSLESGRLGGAALDVFADEPLPLDSPLRGLPNVVLTPHVAYLSADSLADVAHKALGEVLRVLEGDSPLYPVNQPIVGT